MTILQRLILLVLIALLPAIAIQAYNQLAVSDEREQEVRREALRLAEFADGEIARIIENGRGLLLALSVQRSVRSHESETCSAVMRELQPLFPQYLQIGAIDSDGHPFCANLPLPPPGTVWRGKNMTLFLRSPDFQVGFYTESAFAKAPVLMLGLPFRDRDGKLGGVVFAGLDLAWLERSFHEKFADANTTLGVTDREGTILLRLPDSARYLGRRFDRQYLPYVKAARAGTDEIVALDGVTRILGYVPVDSGSPGLYVGIGITKAAALAAVDRASRIGLFLIAGGVLLALLAAWILGRRFFSRPIAQLLAAAASWGRGEFGMRSGAASGRSEIARLGRAFDAMAASLEAKQAENADLLANLERRVAERTAALEHETAERRKAEAALLQSQKLESIGQLTGGVAHDFNNLLTAILSNLEIARKRAGEAGSAITAQIDGALRAAERGATLTQRLLAFGRRQQLTPVALDPGEVLESLRELLARTIGPQIRLGFAVERGVWRVSADRNQLELALLNLVLNARDAMPEGGRITISAGNARAEIEGAAQDCVVIRVTDTGTGMDAATAARAFDPFFTTKETGRGSGLGLSMVYGFALQSGGKAEIASAPGRGTSVALFLPRAAADAAVPAAQLAAAPDLAGGQGRLLLCDDDADVLACMGEALADYGYDCVTVSSGEAALAALAEDERFDAVVLDFAMPGMTGSTVAELIRRHHPDLPMLLVTGYMEATPQRDGSLRLPTLRKPFLPHDLAIEVQKLISLKRSAASAATD